METKNTTSIESLRTRMRTGAVRRWDGRVRAVDAWDGLRRDPELWFANGNCYVHLYARGQSRRGPSFRVPLRALQDARFDRIFSLFYAQATKEVNSFNPTNPGVIELFIPPPDNLTKDAAFAWHLTTRNFFAFLFGKPLVGSLLGRAMVDLQDRLQLLRPDAARNQREVMAYLEGMGYLEFVHCPEYALALLHYAENFRIGDLWIDAFVHCVGMNDLIESNSQLQAVSPGTRTLVARAYAEMDLHLTGVTKALSNFLEEDFGPTYLGLSHGARAHLERFRSFLHSFYVEKFGYWPPPAGSTFSKALYRSMYFDFRSLYDYLVDLDSTDSLQDQKPASGGICVLQNVQAFDRRHHYVPLPHPNPLLPDTSDTPKGPAPRTLIGLRMPRGPSRSERYVNARDALLAAANSHDLATANAPLVKAYRRFERDCTRQPEEKVSIADARKVRWILIYGSLQMLVSVIRAPKEVRDTESASYPLCALVANLPPWLEVPDEPATPLRSSPVVEPLEAPGPPVPAVAIQPDCDTEAF
ncbi:hypothetical protein EJ06DRAFT_464854, partial [Trichodelitschia bisporula]